MLIIYPDTDEVIAHLPGVRAVLKLTAQDGADKAQAVLDDHHHEGHARITVTRGNKLDWFVNLDDTRGQRAAAAIEFGRSGGAHGASQGINALGSAF